MERSVEKFIYFIDFILADPILECQVREGYGELELCRKNANDSILRNQLEEDYKKTSIIISHINRALSGAKN